MFTLEEYILKRKNEDGINEFDFDKRLENTRICTNYVFEYFQNYMETKPDDERTILHERKVDIYRNILRDYDENIQDWLIDLYSSYGKRMHKQIASYVEDPYFLLYDTEAEYRALSYEMYSKIIKKFKFLNGQSERIYQFIIDQHRVKNLFSQFDDFFVCESVDEWIRNAYQDHGVNLFNFCNNWVDYFSDNPDIWPAGYKKRSKYYDEYSKKDYVIDVKNLLWDYDYKQKDNLFNLNSLYRNMPKKSFTKGKKQEFETLLLYCWLHRIEKDDDYWNTYLEIVLPKL